MNFTLEEAMEALERARAEQYAASERAFYLEHLVREMMAKEISSLSIPEKELEIRSVDLGWVGGEVPHACATSSRLEYTPVYH